jgi:hypothetical protein
MRITTGWSLNDPTASNAVTAERRLSLIDAALLWERLASRWSISLTHRAW